MYIEINTPEKQVCILDEDKYEIEIVDLTSNEKSIIRAENIKDYSFKEPFGFIKGNVTIKTETEVYSIEVPSKGGNIKEIKKMVDYFAAVVNPIRHGSWPLTTEQRVQKNIVLQKELEKFQGAETISCCIGNDKNRVFKKWFIYHTNDFEMLFNEEVLPEDIEELLKTNYMEKPLLDQIMSGNYTVKVPEVRIAENDIYYFEVVGEDDRHYEIETYRDDFAAKKVASIDYIYGPQEALLYEKQNPVYKTRRVEVGQDRRYIQVHYKSGIDEKVEIMDLPIDFYELLMQHIPEKEYQFVMHQSQTGEKEEQPLMNNTFDDLFEQLSKAKQLFDNGILSRDEYDKIHQDLMKKGGFK